MMNHRAYFNYFIRCNWPKNFIVVCADRSLIEGCTSNSDDQAKVYDALSNCLCVIISNLNENKWGGQGQHPNGKQAIYIGPSKKDRVVQEFLDSYDGEAKVLAERLADPAKELEYLLQTHDWTFAFSDDHSYWAAGQANLNKIMAKLPDVPEAKARELWAKYAESGIEFPDNLYVR